MKNLSAMVDRFEGEKAILKFSDGQTLIAPIEFMPAGANEGSAVEVRFGNDVESTETQARQAKDLLNEILKKAK